MVIKFRTKNLDRRDTIPSTNSPMLSISLNEASLNSFSGSDSFSVSNVGDGYMGWTASVAFEINWLSIVSGSSSTNDGTIDISYDQDVSSEPKMGTIRVTTFGATSSQIYIIVMQQGTNIIGDFNDSGTVDTFDLMRLVNN